MFNHQANQSPSRSVVAHWFLLSLNAGYVNVGGFLGTGRFVTHVTGFATLFGVDLTTRHLVEALGILTVPAYFLAGSLLAGLLIDRPIFRGKKPHFDYVMGLSSLCLFLAAFGGYMEFFGDFSSEFRLKHVYVLLALLCLASGLQNGAITSSSGSSVRTTHLTGLTTDLGLGLARQVTLGGVGERCAKESRANRLRAGTIASYVVGSALGAYVFMNVGFLGFLFPALVDAYAAWHGRMLKVMPHRLEAV